MSTVTKIFGTLEVTEDFKIGGGMVPGLGRSSLVQDDLAVYPIDFVNFRVHDALQTTLPGTSASDDLGLYGGTFGTSQPLIRTFDVKTLSTSLYARTQVALPAEYVAGETVKIRLGAGMITTVADTSCTADVEAYKVGKDNSLGSDICATSATSMNSLTFANKDFTITSGTLSPGDVLDIRIRVTVVDSATVGAVIGAFASCDLLADIKG